MKIRLPKKFHVMIMFEDQPSLQGLVARELEPILKKIAYKHNLGFREIVKGTQRSWMRSGRVVRATYQIRAEFSGRNEEWMMGYLSWSLRTGELEDFYTMSREGRESTYE